jgi:hypothetical protein
LARWLSLSIHLISSLLQDERKEEREREEGGMVDRYYC